MDTAKREAMAERIMQQLAEKADVVVNQTDAIEASLIQFYAIHAALQLAMRHPEFGTGDVREMVEGFVGAIEAAFEEYGIFDQETLEFLRQDQAEVEVEGQTRIIIPEGL